MSHTSVEAIRPAAGWALCQSIQPVKATARGILFAKDMEGGKTSEGLATVLAVTPGRTKKGAEEPPGFSVGDIILIRDFLKTANKVGGIVGADREDRVFLLNNKDALAVVTGPCTLGYYEEYVIE